MGYPPLIDNDPGLKLQHASSYAGKTKKTGERFRPSWYIPSPSRCMQAVMRSLAFIGLLSGWVHQACKTLPDQNIQRIYQNAIHDTSLELSILIISNELLSHYRMENVMMKGKYTTNAWKSIQLYKWFCLIQIALWKYICGEWSLRPQRGYWLKLC